MTVDLTALLRDADAGATVTQLAATHQLSSSRVYGILREYRPERERSPRPRTSKVPAKIQALAAAGCEPKRVADLLRVSRQYVYRWWPKPNE